MFYYVYNFIAGTDASAKPLGTIESSPGNTKKKPHFGGSKTFQSEIYLYLSMKITDPIPPTNGNINVRSVNKNFCFNDIL